MIDKINRSAPVSRSAKTSTNRQKRADAKKSKSQSTIQKVLLEYRDSPDDTVKKQLITQVLIEKFGEKIVNEPKFNQLCKFIEQKFQNSEELSDLIESLINQ